MSPPEPWSLPLWRQRVMPALMAGLRVAIVWVIFRDAARFVLAPPVLVHLPNGLRGVFLALVAVGVPLFVWPRTCWAGGVALVAAIAVYESLWRGAGLPAGGMPWVAVGLIVVLVLGEWIGRLAQRRIYAQSD